MNNKYKKLIISLAVILIGFSSNLFTEYLPKNQFGLVILTILSVCKLGGLIMFFTALVKIFTKEKNEELSDLHITLKRNKLLMGSLFFLVLGIIFSCSTILLPYLCGSKDPICPVTSIGISFLFFIPVGIVLLIIGALKLFKFFKYK